MGGRKNTADIEFTEQLAGRIDAIALAGKADVHDGQRGVAFPREADRFFRGRRGADDVETGVGSRRFGLHGDQEVVLDDQDARRPALDPGIRAWDFGRESPAIRKEARNAGSQRRSAELVKSNSR